MKTKVTVLIVILFAVLLAALTCPGKEAHVDAVKAAVVSYVDAKATEETDNAIVSSFLGSLFAGKLAEMFLDTKLEVKNYVLFSVGQVTLEGKTKTVSVGAFNHVFTYDKDDIARVVNK